jgi:hypothetical protein
MMQFLHGSPGVVRSHLHFDFRHWSHAVNFTEEYEKLTRNKTWMEWGLPWAPKKIDAPLLLRRLTFFPEIPVDEVGSRLRKLVCDASGRSTRSETSS